jgi:hypothetical protein
VTGILGSDQNRFTQDAQGARGHVFEISDRGGYKVKYSHAGILSPSFVKNISR